MGIEDGGRYTCVATSPKRVINATITLSVVVKPKFSVKPQNTTVKEGDSVLIDCAAEGDPTPTISVSLDGRSLILSLSFVICFIHKSHLYQIPHFINSGTKTVKCTMIWMSDFKSWKMAVFPSRKCEFKMLELTVALPEIREDSRGT